ncbi:choice-of-anchor I family protein [Guggenheimella bovis]
MKRKLALVLVLVMMFSVVQGFALTTENIVYPTLTTLIVDKAHSFDSGSGEAGTEIVDVAPKAGIMATVNGAEKSLDLTKMDETKFDWKVATRINVSNLLTGNAGDITSVAIAPNEKYLAIAVPAKVKTDIGHVLTFDLKGNIISAVEVGALPDMLTISSDSKKILVANEGEPSDDYKVDPNGSVSVITVSESGKMEKSATVDFTGVTIPETVRKSNPAQTYPQNIEPEYIVLSKDNQKAYVACQESNIIAIFDIPTLSFEKIVDLGTKDFSFDAKMDPSDKDKVAKLRNVPILSFYMPDGMSIINIAGKDYILTANEGDTADWEGYSEEVRVAKLAGKDKIALKATNYKGFTQAQLDQMVKDGLFNEDQLGRLKVTTAQGEKDGKYETLYGFGGRSFSVLDSNANMIYDSGNDFASIPMDAMPNYFNCEGTPESFDSRSDDKGVEPEGVASGYIDGVPYAFVGTERLGAIFVYDLSNPQKPAFVRVIEPTSKDISPEGIRFVPAEESKTGKATLYVAHEISGTVAVYTFSNRIAGQNRYETASKISKETFMASDVALLASGENFPDALSAAPLAASYNAPLLLTKSNDLPVDTQAELSRLGVKKLTIIGGEKAVSKEVEQKAKDMGLEVTRIFGADRYETSRKIYEAVKAHHSFTDVFVASGQNFADALSIAPIASHASNKAVPILLTPQNKAELKNVELLGGIKNVTVIGGEMAVSKEAASIYAPYNMKRIAGNTRFETSALIATTYHDKSEVSVVANGQNFPDALAGSIYAAKLDAPMVLVDSKEVPTAAETFLKKNVKNAIVLGGELSITRTVNDTILDLVK